MAPISRIINLKLLAFKINIDNSSVYHSIKLIDTQNNCTAQVFCFGGLLNAFTIDKNNKTYNVIDGYENVDDAVAQKNTWFKSCKLSPFVCRLSNGKYTWHNEDYTIKKFYLGKHAIHGLVYDAVYEIAETKTTESLASVVLQYTYTASDKGYPFEFTIKIIYTLQADCQLTIQTIVQHKNKESIPYCDGWHPYFKLDAAVDDCSLQFNSQSLIEFDSELIPTGKMIEENAFASPRKLKNISLDNCYKLEENTSCTLKGKDIELTITPIKNYNYLQVFIPDHRENIAIENLSALPDAFNNKIGLSVLEPDKEYEFSVEYRLKLNDFIFNHNET